MPASMAGLIPAHAGKTIWIVSTKGTDRAHPRSRGENAQDGGGERICEGSSPLTRGKHDARRREPFRDGLIPAHAGKTPSEPST